MRTTDAVALTQSLDTVEPGGNALCCQLGLNLLRAIDAATPLMRGFDGSQQARILKQTCGNEFATAPCLIAALGDVHELTQLVRGMGVTQFIGHGVLHFDSFAKNAIAFSGCLGPLIYRAPFWESLILVQARGYEARQA